MHKKSIRYKLFLTTLILLVFIFSNVASIFAALQPLPASKTPTNIRNIFDTNLFTGSASYAYPIKIPKGTNDLTPDVSLSYSSLGSRDFMRVGSGWQMSHDYVERDVNFTPADMGDDKFKLHFKGGVSDLVYVASDSRYHSKTENFLNIQKLTGGVNDKGDYWQVITPDGTKYRFGYGYNSEFVANARPYVTYWSLDLVTDVHGNNIYYTYLGGNGTDYLSQIRYNNDQSRIIDFNYTTSPYQRQLYMQGASVTEHNRLSSIQIKIGANLIRQYDFNYTTGANNQSLLQSITEKGSDGSALPPATFDYKPTIKNINTTYETWVNNAPMDVHLEKTDVVLADATGDGLLDIVKSEGNGTNTWKVWKNTGTSWNTTYETWVNNAPMDAKLDRSDTKFTDVTGDNLPDIIKTHNNGSTWTIYRNTGNSWNTTAETWANYTSLQNASVGISDVNGDGLADLIRSIGNGGGSYATWEIYINNGSGWNNSVKWWDNVNRDVWVEQTDVRLMDVNGDGLPDIVKVRHNGTNATWEVYKNTGNTWITTPELWINNAPVDVWLEQTSATVTDINGDGLPDIVKSEELGSADRWKVLLNLGNSWATTWEDWIPTSANVDLSLQANTQMADVNGDGLADVIRTAYSGSNDLWHVWKNDGKSPDLLSTITTPQGGKINFDYKSSTTFDNTGVDALSDLPFNLWVVDKMTVNNGMTNTQGTNDITTYIYKDGFYDWQDREFRGFAEVNTTEPNGSKKKYVFKQDDAMKGRLDEMQHRNTSDDPYSETDNTWSSSTTDGVTTVKLDNEKFITYDGTTSGAKTIQNDYTYDSYGNVTKKSEKGDISITTDDRFIYNEYTIESTAWITNTVKHTYTNASDDTTKINENWFYYDGHTGINDAPTKGNLTKKVDWLSGGTNPQTTYAYDSYGNQISVTDANGHTTTAIYNMPFTYPISTTNAKNQTTTMNYDLGTGNLLSKTDPNGSTTTYTYDVFGRITKEIKPDDSSSFPTTAYQYFNDGIAPEGMLISKRETSGQPETLDVYTWVDGLSRTIQTGAEAEDSNKKIVTDTFYDQNGKIFRKSVPYLATSSAAPSPTAFGDGSDGDITITSNIIESPIDSSVTATTGTNTATVGSGLGFAINQIVLFHQTQGAGAGLWEYARVQAYSGTTLTLTTNLANSYSSSGSNKAQVRVVPQYNNLTVNSGATLNAKSWDGTKGGILAFLAKGTVTISGTINATGKGLRGASLAAGKTIGRQGEGTSGAGDASSVSANGSGGGGGDFLLGSYNGGAAGGGNGTSGGTGHRGTGVNASSGGSTTGSSDLTTMSLGGGGGSGSADYSTITGGAGGNGGGIIFITGATITNGGGAITANGNAGQDRQGSNAGGGGGGAGGSINLKVQSINLSAGVSAIGGAGGSTDPVAAVAGVGGDGRIRIEYETSITGTTSPASSSLQTQIPLLPGAPSATGSSSYTTPDTTAKYTEYTYDPIGRMSIIRNPKGDSKTIAYDHWKTTSIDENGHIKREFRNAFDKINKVEEVNGVSAYTTTYDYDSRDLLTKITDHANNISTFTYDSLGRKISQVDPDMGTWQYTYDAVGNLLTQKDNRNITTTKTYDELNRLTKTDYPTDTDNTFAYDLGKIGTLSIATDSAGTVNYTYDNRLRKTAEQRTVNGTTKTTQFAYDTMDRLVSQTYPDGEVVNFAFNTQGEINSASGSAVLMSNLDYDALGKITKKDFGNGVTTNYTYNANDFRLNRIQTGTLFDKNYTYDNVSNIASITDNLTSKTQQFTYDDLDRLATASESAGFNYSYQYSPIGNLTKFTNSGVETDYTYGSGSALPHALTSSTGTGGTATSSATPIIMSSSSGSISSGGLTLSKPTGTVDGDLLIMTASADLSASENVTYTTPSGWTQILANTRSDPTSAGNNLQVWYKIASSEPANYTITPDHSNLIGGSIIRINGHDPANPINVQAVTASLTGEADAPAVTTTVDNALILRLVTWDQSKTVNSIPVGHTQSYHVDVSGHDNWGGYEEQATAGDTGEAQFDLSAGSPYVGLTLAIKPEVSSSATVYEAENATLSGAVFANNQPGYNGTGFADYINTNNDYVEWTVNTSVSDTHKLEFRYANGSVTDRPLQLKVNGVIVIPSLSFAPTGSWTTWSIATASASLNAGANLVRLTAIGSSGANVDYLKVTPLNTSPSAVYYTYDANGNMLSDGAKIFEYNEENQLKRVKHASSSATIAEYVYDFNGNRMVKRNFLNGVLDNTVTSWSDAFETKVVSGGATTNTSYYFINGELVAKKNNSGAITYVHNDHLGSSSVITDATGALVESTSYDPWGKVNSGGTVSKFQYTGQEKDSETGLNYYNARYYDSDIRRFTQPDSLISNIYNPQDLNRYSYVNNNPLRYTDPSGHITIGRDGTISSIFLPPQQNKKPQTVQEFIKVATQPSKPQNTASQPSNSSSRGNKSGSISSNGGGSPQNSASVMGSSTSSNSTAINAQSNVNRSSLGSGGICMNGSVGIGGYMGNSVCGVVTANKEVAILITPEKGLTTGFSAGISFGVMFSTAQSVQDLIDQNDTTGLSAGPVGGTYSWDTNNSSNWSVYGGFGPGLSITFPGVPVTGQKGNSLDTLPILYHPF